MNEAVLDASVVLKWFHSEGEEHLEAARKLRERFEAGELRVLAPPLLWLEILNVAARRWRWTDAKMEQLAATLPGLGFELVEPELVGVARWASQGLTEPSRLSRRPRKEDVPSSGEENLRECQPRRSTPTS